MPRFVTIGPRSEQETQCARLRLWLLMNTAGSNSTPSRPKLDLPEVIRELRRLLAIERELTPVEIDAMCELRLALRRQFLDHRLEKR